MHDMLFPGGKCSKVCRLRTPDMDKFSVTEVLRKYKLIDPTPVIVIAGSRYSEKEKFYGGIVRTAFKTGAIIIDSGIRSGLEKFA